MLALLVTAVAAIAAATEGTPAPAGRPGADAGEALRRATSFKAAQLSPDGKRLAWVESVAGPDGQLPQAGILRLLELGKVSAQPVRVTAGNGAPADEGQLAWSADSKHLAFVSDARSAGQGQVFIADAAGGEVRAVTSAKGGVAEPRWSPDGKRIAFLFLEGVTDLKGPMATAPRETGVIQEDVKLQRIAVVDAAGGELKLVSPADLHVYEHGWSPDGASFVAVGAHGPGDQSWWTAGLYVIPAAGGEARPLRQPKLQIARPRWSPDGKRIAFIEGLMSDEDLVGGDLLVIDAAGGEPKNLTADRRTSIGALDWHAQGEIVVVEWVSGQSGAAVVNPSSGEVKTLWRGPEHLGFSPYFLDLSLARDGTAAAVSQTFDRGAEIFAGPLRDRAAWTQRTHANPALKPPFQARSLTWKSEGHEVQGWLLEPVPAKAGRGPMVVIVHGGPSYAHQPELSPIGWALTAAGYRVLLPNPRGSFGQGEAFARANVRDFGGGDLRDLLAGVDAALAANAAIDPQRLGLFGWSYGGFMAMWTQTQTHRFQAYVSGAGISNWQSYYGTNRFDTWMLPFFGASVYDDVEAYRRCSAIEQIKKAKAPMLLLHGERDSEVPLTQSFEHWHALKALGVPTQLVVYPDEGHVPQKPQHKKDIENRIVGWFEKWLGGDKKK